MPRRLLALVAVSAALACESVPLNYQDPNAVQDPNVCAMGKRVLTSDVINARDLGGMPLTSGESTACGALFRGPPLSRLTASGCDDVTALGVHTVIDLRTPDESLSNPETACVGEGRTLVAAPLPIPYNVSTADYIADLNASESMATAFATLGDDGAYPIYFHCTWGRDRTGILAALVYLALGASEVDIVKEYSLSASLVGAYPDSLRGALAEIEHRGGIEAYLTTLGVSQEQRAILRTHAVAQPPTAPSP
ncbi:MAG: tyrosine-protein phosphatase [Polyangiaceae bacterium]